MDRSKEKAQILVAQLEQMRKEARLAQRHVAHLCGVCLREYSNWLSYHRLPMAKRMDRVESVVETLGADMRSGVLPVTGAGRATSTAERRDAYTSDALARLQNNK